jgi:hypothetical protein
MIIIYGRTGAGWGRDNNNTWIHGNPGIKSKISGSGIFVITHANPRSTRIISLKIYAVVFVPGNVEYNIGVQIG